MIAVTKKKKKKKKQYDKLTGGGRNGLVIIFGKILEYFSFW